MINLTDLTDEFAAPAASSTPTTGNKIRSALSRFHAAVVKSREAQANRSVHRYLGQHDDAQLVRMGFTVDEIIGIRAATRGHGSRT
jgi:hypothetical protein